ncbi:MAG: hypothetical protein DMG82_14485 [Acidobacteria bacterium]|nr:MAG: hypothetical protein DMG82_14485 [Acidobacteriota bacterium]
MPLSTALASAINQELTTKDTKGSTKAAKVSFVSSFVSLVVDFVFCPAPAELARIRNFQEIFTIAKSPT